MIPSFRQLHFMRVDGSPKFGAAYDFYHPTKPLDSYLLYPLWTHPITGALPPPVL